MTTLSAVRIEGGLLAPDLFDQLLASELPGQRPADFGLQGRRGLTDEVAALFADARTLWSVFQHRLERLPEQDAATTVTRDAWMIPFLNLLGYELRYNQRAYEVDGLSFAISHRAGESEDAPVVHIVGARQALGRVPESGRPRLAPHSLVQEFLNRTEQLWGVVTNGVTLRLLRNSTFVRRQAYVEFDLKSILEDQRFQDFAVLYRLLHRSRLPGPAEPSVCWLSKYYDRSVEQGGRVREHLREGVEECICRLADGFLRYEANAALRRRVAPDYAGADPIRPENLYRQLLKLIYRLLFLLVAEDRGLLSPDPVYREHYGIARLRRLVDQRAAFNAYDDLWQSLRVLWRVLTHEELAPLLQLAPLNGELFTRIDLDDASIANQDLLSALWHLAYYQEKATAPPQRVNYAALDVEELGSVYESLLEFHPAIDPNPGGPPVFKLVSGSERKSTGSYYTPPALVAELIKSALEPVLAERLAATSAQGKKAALLAIRVCDPACGSGHFLLAAARRLGRELAQLDTGEDEPAPERVREATRDVIGHCIYGVDKNPLAVDLCRVALWLESHVADRPLTFLDQRIRLGDSLAGVFDLKTLASGIPDEAFKLLSGDDKDTAGMLKRRNREERRGQRDLLAFHPAEDLAAFGKANAAIEAIGNETPEAVRRKAALFAGRVHNPDWARQKEACDLWTAAFFQRLRPNVPAITSAAVLDRIGGRPVSPQVLAIAIDLEDEAHFFHWPLEFPEVFAAGGFDVVLGNPPWERIKLQEQEFFAARDATIAKAPNAAARGRMIAALAEAKPGSRERALHEEFVRAKRLAEASSVFAREGGRFALTGRGDINTYALFAELFADLVSVPGRAGVIAPTGIATDATTAPFFAALIGGNRVARLIDFENRNALFPAVHRSYKFSLLTMGHDIAAAEFSFFLTHARQVAEPERRFTLSLTDIARINPNTKTAPLFRSRADAELTAKIYARVPVLIDEAKGSERNPWDVSFATMFHMANDSALFRTAAQLRGGGFRREGNDWLNDRERYVPLFESKMFDQFNHRYADYSGRIGERGHRVLPEIPTAALSDPCREAEPYYWVPYQEVTSRTPPASALIGYGEATTASTLRTCVMCAFPFSGVGHKEILLFTGHGALGQSILLANGNSLVLDFIARTKISYLNLGQYIFKQLPFILPAVYKDADRASIVPRALELTYTSHTMAPFARDLGYGGPPFAWNEDRRAHLRAELDAWYARAYGLTRNELRYILDPQDVKGPDYPSETFRVLKTNEIRRFGEYRTARLVLAAYDQLDATKVAAQ